MAALTRVSNKNGKLLDGLLREELALIDELVMIKSQLFLGNTAHTAACHAAILILLCSLVRRASSHQLLVM
jgi:hypothetical protein